MAPSIEQIRQVAQRIGHEFNADKVVLFGSQATGSANAASDVDLLVIGTFAQSLYQLSGEIRGSLQVNFPVDIVVRSASEVAGRLAGGDPILQEAFEKGIVLYRKAA